jgi:hypothetical protein
VAKGSFPALNVETTVHVGDVMVSEYDYVAREQATTLENVSGSFWKGRTSLPSGSILQKTAKDGVIFYCLAPGVQSTPCLVDSDHDLAFDKYYLLNLYGSPVGGGNMDAVPYRLSDGVVQSGFKYELIYQGIHDNLVNISYREYSQDLARPAFQQDLQYTLETGSTAVNFKDVRIAIHSANNNQIVYTVVSGLDT